jgi:hypothetical protein
VRDKGVGSARYSKQNCVCVGWEGGKVRSPNCIKKIYIYIKKRQLMNSLKVWQSSSAIEFL